MNTLRLSVPVESHVPENPPQDPQPPYVTPPHEVPFVVREHASVSVEVPLSQAPLAQTGVVIMRVRVPVSSHVPLKPPQALQPPIVTAPHEPPSVPRMHARVSEETSAVQLPLWHVFAVTDRDSVPVSSHVPPNPPQAP